MKIRLVAIAVVSALSVALTLFPGCSNQAEGERCDTNGDNGGNDDCQSGLVCVHANQLNGASDSDRCCPPDRSRATADICKLSTTPVGGDAAPPPSNDSGTTPDVNVQDSGGGDAPVDSPPDTASPADASDSG